MVAYHCLKNGCVLLPQRLPKLAQNRGKNPTNRAKGICPCDTGHKAGLMPGMTTYQLHTVLPATAANVYALACTVDQALTMPAAFQVVAPFDVDIGGVNAGVLRCQRRR